MMKIVVSGYDKDCNTGIHIYDELHRPFRNTAAGSGTEIMKKISCPAISWEV